MIRAKIIPGRLEGGPQFAFKDLETGTVEPLEFRAKALVRVDGVDLPWIGIWRIPSGQYMLHPDEYRTHPLARQIEVVVQRKLLLFLRAIGEWP